MSNQREEIAAFVEWMRADGRNSNNEKAIQIIESLTTRLATAEEQVGMLRKALEEIETTMRGSLPVTHWVKERCKEAFAALEES